MINNKYQVTDILKQSKNKTIQRILSNNKNYYISKTFEKSDHKFFKNEINIYSLIK
jgi:hypothetical protein